MRDCYTLHLSLNKQERRDEGQCVVITSTRRQLDSFVRTWDTRLKKEFGGVILTTNTFLGKYSIVTIMYWLNYNWKQTFDVLIVLPVNQTIIASQNTCYRNWLDDNNVPIVIDNVDCNEDDKSISNCSARLISHNCGHEKNIWLQCKGKSSKK